MLHFLISILVSSQTAWGAGPTAAEIQAEVTRLEEALRNERDLESTRDAVVRRLIEVRDLRFAKNQDSIALGLVTVPTKAFPNPITAQQKLGELKIQATILTEATKKFDELRTKPDSEESAPPAVPSQIPIPVTTFSTLKQSLDQFGDPIIETSGALSKLADQAREKGKIAQAAEKKKGADAENEEEDPDDPHLRTGSDPTPLPEATLNQFTADAFSRSARAADDYLKFAALLMGPVARKEQEVNRARDLAAAEPPPADVTPPETPRSESPPPNGGGAKPAAQKPKGDGNKNDKAQAKNSDDKKDADKKDDKGGDPSGGSPAQSPKSNNAIATLGAATIAQPQSHPDLASLILNTSLGPREADFSALSELTRAAIDTPRTGQSAFLAGKIETPNLNVPPANPASASATRQPTSLPARPLIEGNFKPLQATASPGSSAATEGNAPSAPPVRISGSPLAASGGDGSLPKGGPVYPEEGAKIRRILGTAGSSFEIIDETSPIGGSTGAVFAGFGNQIMMPLGVDKPADRRGILSRVGTLCRSVDLGKVPACARTR